MKRLVIDKINFIDFNNVNGIQTVCGSIAHAIMFQIEKGYRELTKKPSKVCFEVVSLEHFASKFSLQLVTV